MQVDFYDDTKSLHNIGQAIMEYEPVRNAFTYALVNRIGMVLVESSVWDDPWAVFDKGRLEMGETVEEIFVNIGRPYGYNPKEAADKFFAREIPDIRAAFHTLNYQKFYKQTIERQTLELAFIGWGQFNDVIAGIVESMYTAMKLDLFLVRKYMICREILNGGMYMVEHGDIATEEGAKSAVKKFRKITNDLTFLKSIFNRAHVRRATPVADQIIIVPNEVEANIGVDVLAAAFHISQVEYLGTRIAIDSWEFDADDIERLALIFEDDKDYKAFTGEEITTLQKVSAVKVDRGYMMNFNKFLEARNMENPQGLYWNYWLHVWYIFSISPYHNAVAFTWNSTEVTGVTVTPTAQNVAQGSQLQMEATVSGTGLYSKTVIWSIKGQKSSETKIDAGTGLLVVAPDEEEGNEITVTATAVDGQDASATATISVVNG